MLALYGKYDLPRICDFAFYYIFNFQILFFQYYRVYTVWDRRWWRMDCTLLPVLFTWESRRMYTTEHLSIALITRFTRCRLLHKSPPEAKFLVFSHNNVCWSANIHHNFFLSFRRKQERFVQSRIIASVNLLAFSRIYSIFHQ